MHFCAAVIRERLNHWDNLATGSNEDKEDDEDTHEQEEEVDETIFGHVQIGSKASKLGPSLAELQARGTTDPAFYNFIDRLNAWIRSFLDRPGVIESLPNEERLGTNTPPLNASDTVCNLLILISCSNHFS